MTSGQTPTDTFQHFKKHVRKGLRDLQGFDFMPVMVARKIRDLDESLDDYWHIDLGGPPEDYAPLPLEGEP